MDLAPDFDEFLGSLIDHHVEFLVVGAYALAVHGAPRFTGDLHILIRPTVDNGERFLAAVRACGFPIEDLTPSDVIESTRIVQLGVEPVQIHIMSAISGVSWQEASSNRMLAAFGSHQVPFLGRETFLRNKKASGRPKDLADIDALEPGYDGR
jgi:hypothetical protein